MQENTWWKRLLNVILTLLVPLSKIYLFIMAVGCSGAFIYGLWTMLISGFSDGGFIVLGSIGAFIWALFLVTCVKLFKQAIIYIIEGKKD